MIVNNYLKLKLLKNPFLKISAPTIKSLEKKKPSKNSVKEIYFALQYLIALNTKILLNSFHDQIFLRNTVFSVLISGVKILLIGLRNAVIDNYIFSTLYKRFYFSLPLNPAIHRMGITPYIL